MIYQENAHQLTQFRQQVYQNFNKRADVMMDLIDALSSNTSARSVVELSLNPVFRRDYTSLFKAIEECQIEVSEVVRSTEVDFSAPKQRSFWLLGVDVTPQARRFAATLEDRGFVYQPNTLKGNKPVTIGHQYSSVVLLPEKETERASPWVVPLSNQRVKSWEDKEKVGGEQMASLLADERLPFQDELCVEVGDTSYSKPAYLAANRQFSNLVTIVRVRSNRTFYSQPVENEASEREHSGHPTWFGQAFRLSDPETWPEPDETLATTHLSRRGRLYQVRIQAWHNKLMRGKQKPAPIPMHRYPFTLLRVCLYNDQGELAFQRPLWLIVVGERRLELSLLEIYRAYIQRFDIEHFFRFGKQKLLLDKFQTPETAHEETWWQLVHLAYLQLWVARSCAQCLPRPWERHLPAVKTGIISPGFVQRDFKRIIHQLGTPAEVPKPRGIPPGRRKGMGLVPRMRRKVIRKSAVRPETA